MGFVARTLVGGYRTIAGKPKTIEIEMVEAEVVPKDQSPIQLKENDFVDLKESVDAPKLDPKVGTGSALNPRNVAADKLRKLASDHNKVEIEGNKPQLFHALGNGSVVFRILPPAKNHEVFSRREENGKPRYFYNVVIRDKDNNPQVLCIPESVHKKIVAAFTEENYDCADLVDGCDFVMNRLDFPNSPYSYRFELEKGTRCHAGEPAEVEGWLRKTANLNTFPSRPVAVSEEGKPPYPSEKDEGGKRQRHFSQGEKVRLIDSQKVYDKLSSGWETAQLSWICDKNHKILTHRDRWQNNIRPEVGDCGEIVGFVMEIKDNYTVPYHSGVAVVRFAKLAHNSYIYAAVSFDGLESLEIAESDDQKTIKTGDWVHWKTQAGHISVRPSVVFKTRKSKGVNEVQLGYAQKSKVIRFWCPISKCQKLIGSPAAFTNLLAHQLPEAVLAEKLRSI